MPADATAAPGMLESLVATYGYAAVLIGTFLEGETVLVLGGFAAHRGYLDLPWVVAAAFAGTVAGDQLYFYLGRLHGRSWLARRPAWQRESERVLALLHRHQTLVILGFRFLYGVRTVSPFVIGMSRVSPLRFTILNAVGAAVWAVAIGGLGYVFGHALEAVLGEVQRYEHWILAGIAAAGAVAWLVHVLRERSRSKG